MSAPGVGVLVSLTFASAVDDPGRFKRSRQVGAHFGLTPKRSPRGDGRQLVLNCELRRHQSGVGINLTSKLAASSLLTLFFGRESHRAYA